MAAGLIPVKSCVYRMYLCILIIVSALTVVSLVALNRE